MNVDLTVVVHGRKGCGKSALIGEIAALIHACGGEVLCVAGRQGEPKKPVRTPDEDNFHRALNVKLVEVVD
jgi:ABC-type sugar transport system ATPase subunit